MPATTRAAARAHRAGVGACGGARPAVERGALAARRAHRRATDSVTTEADPGRGTARVLTSSGGLAAGNVSGTGSGHVYNN